MFLKYVCRSGLSRTDWAKRLEISKSYMSDLLNGKRIPSLEVAVRIERATGGAVPASSWINSEDAA
ncbi:helix-turn-helix transcriptional regulator [Shimia thalassica]|uniref:helix-turn-helix transcriptional regulator n=1 Tax=Shimia thalassica TaxID=1715693 RepID=UPI00349F596D